MFLQRPPSGRRSTARSSCLVVPGRLIELLAGTDVRAATDGHPGADYGTSLRHARAISRAADRPRSKSKNVVESYTCFLRGDCGRPAEAFAGMSGGPSWHAIDRPVSCPCGCQDGRQGRSSGRPQPSADPNVRRWRRISLARIRDRIARFRRGSVECLPESSNRWTTRHAA